MWPIVRPVSSSASRRGFFSRLHMIDLAADDIPIAGFRWTHAFVKKDLGVAQNHQADAETRKIKTGHGHWKFRPWRCRRSA